MADTPRKATNLLKEIQEAQELQQLNEDIKTAERIKSLAGRGLTKPEALSLPEVKELCGSVLRHIERYGPRKI